MNVNPIQFGRKIKNAPDKVWSKIAGAVLGSDATNDSVYGRQPTQQMLDSAKQWRERK